MYRKYASRMVVIMPNCQPANDPLTRWSKLETKQNDVLSYPIRINARLINCVVLLDVCKLNTL